MAVECRRAGASLQPCRTETTQRLPYRKIGSSATLRKLFSWGYPNSHFFSISSVRPQPAIRSQLSVLDRRAQMLFTRVITPRHYGTQPADHVHVRSSSLLVCISSPSVPIRADARGITSYNFGSWFHRHSMNRLLAPRVVRFKVSRHGAKLRHRPHSIQIHRHSQMLQHGDDSQRSTASWSS